MSSSTPITEADLHAWADGQLAAERAREVEAYLAARPEELRRVEAWREQKAQLRALFDPVLDEPAPARLLRAARPRQAWWLQRLAAGLAIALLGGALGWGLRGQLAEQAPQLAQAGPAGDARLPDLAERAAIAHAVYSPDQRRPVEVDAAHEDQLVAWLSKRIGATMRPPHLQSLGYALEGGRLLPGASGPVAQFMYRDAAGAKLTLYVSRESGAAEPAGDTAFRFARRGELNVFYWVDGPFGYALSAGAERAELARVSAEVYKQLGQR
ncbi:anti-sigma factor family protein [Roseateles violae]|uniref:Anti-sigma factor n=1 Tax=Roseateles violae TaxID=3058042 RepID=A0ABT8DWG1_9BURK|nr:anti-sigma factor [Pelomonas sp. PFR6]MDN3921375.1 anti-sigma factor [Pelomonas sp. PFR6]